MTREESVEHTLKMVTRVTHGLDQGAAHDLDHDELWSTLLAGCEEHVQNPGDITNVMTLAAAAILSLARLVEHDMVVFHNDAERVTLQ